jgi:GNAT superfamily N-acetyltransferase
VSGRFRIEGLGKRHDRPAFHCGSDALDQYLHRQVSQDVRRRLTACFVAVEIDTEALAGYYTLSATSIALDALPEAQIKRLPSYPHVPAALLGRLAVSEFHQGLGLGGMLLIDALTRTLSVELGVYALLVEAKDAGAEAFYEHYGFIALPGSGARRLMLPMATAKGLL